MTAPRFATLSRPLAAMPHLPAMLGGTVHFGPFVGNATMLGWGDRGPARLAATVAGILRRPLLRLEDGFLRSVGLGKAGAPTVSIIRDTLGMHFDAHRPSDIELLISRSVEDKGARRLRAATLVETIIQNRLDKYNLSPDPQADPDSLTGKVLLVDQVYGDRSIVGAGASQRSFVAMLDAALATFDQDRIVVKTHPDVMNGYARGNMTEVARARGVRLFDRQVGIDDLAGRISAVFTVSSTIGFEALMRGIPVSTFGMPFYAGWGLTEDHAGGPVADRARARRQARPEMLDLVAAVFLDYTRFGDPWHGTALAPEEGIALLSRWKRGDVPGKG